jgi:hypothetical protein
MDELTDQEASGGGDHLIGLLVALAIVIAVAAAFMIIFGVPAAQDCTCEHYGKASFSADCVKHVE